MVWHNLRIGSHIAKIKPLVVRMPKLKDVDENGDEVKKVQIAKAEYKWIRAKDNKEISKVYKSHNDRVFRKLSKTTEVKDYAKMTRAKAVDLNAEKHYLVVCDTLNEELKDSEAIGFYFSNGNGFKIYQAVVYREKGNLIMSCGLGFKSELIENIDVAKQGTDETTDETVDRATVDDMVAIVGIES